MERFWLFFASLSPAILIASIRFMASYPCLAWIGVGCGIIGSLASYLLLLGRENVGARPITPTGVQDETDQIPTYLITFVFPFLFITEEPDIYTLIAYGVFVLFMMALLFRSDVALVNPALLIAGYHVYSVEENSQTVKVISRKRPVTKTTFNAHSISGSLYLAADSERT